jgi:NAD(P)H-hydrate epimerase
MGTAVIRAELTLTFGTSKPGLHTGEGRVLAGEVSVIHLGALAPIASCERWLAREVTVAPRAIDAHKGTAGRVLIVGGSAGTVGAGWLSALGAHRMGAGLVTLASRANSQAALHTIETMTLSLDGDERSASDAVATAVRATDAAVVGPGLGRDAWARSVLEAVLAIDRPRVLDGDALTLLGAGGARSLGERTVLTPHPLEAARLLGAADATEINRDRVSAARAIAARYECAAVLKGAGTVIALRDGRVWVLPFAEPTLAIAGSGDVLAGAIAARLADREGAGRPWHEAAIEGAFAHGRAGVSLRARRGTVRGALAHELADELAAGW